MMKPPVWRLRAHAIAITAFAFKAIGAAWDISYHFKYLRELYQLPHILNGVGNFLLFFILFYWWRKESPKERGAIKTMFVGALVFVVGIAFDQWWHSRFGIDLTIWSPAHMMLYLGTLIAILGAMMQVAKDDARGFLNIRARRVLYLALGFFVFDFFWFLLTQQEQAVLSYDAIQKGHPLTSPELLDALARGSRFIRLGLRGAIYGVPDWVYGAWAVFGSVSAFRLMKYFPVEKFSSTIIVAIYLIFRLTMNTILQASNYQTSITPYFILALAVLFDLLAIMPAVRARPFSFALFMGAAGAGLLAGASAISASFAVIPPLIRFPDVLLSLPAALIAFAVAAAIKKILFKPIVPLRQTT